MRRPKGLQTESSADLFYLWAAALTFVGVVFVAMFSTPARSQVPDAEVVCFTPDFVKRTTKARLIAPFVIEQKGEIALAFIARLNAAGDPTNWAGDHVMLWMVPNRPPLQVMVFNKGCATVQCLYGKGCLPVHPKPKLKGIKL